MHTSKEEEGSVKPQDKKTRIRIDTQVRASTVVWEQWVDRPDNRRGTLERTLKWGIKNSSGYELWSRTVPTWHTRTAEILKDLEQKCSIVKAVFYALRYIKSDNIYMQKDQETRDKESIQKFIKTNLYKSAHKK